MSSFTSNHSSTPSTASPPTNKMSATQPVAIMSSRRSSNASTTSSQGQDYFSSYYHVLSSPSTAHPIPYSSSMLRKQSQSGAGPSAYISDEDLFGDDSGYLTEPPPPPRAAEAWLARPLLPPVTATDMTGSKGRRRSSATKDRRANKTATKMTG